MAKAAEKAAAAGAEATTAAAAGAKVEGREGGSSH
jgi:hypothetical protein